MPIARVRATTTAALVAVLAGLVFAASSAVAWAGANRRFLGVRLSLCSDACARSDPSGSGTRTRMRSSDVPDGFRPLADAGAFVELVGPVHVNDAGVLGIRVEDRHLNRAGLAMGGFLATLVDVALGRAIREESDGDAKVATASLTTDYLRAGRSGAWLEAHMTSRVAAASAPTTASPAP